MYWSRNKSEAAFLWSWTTPPTRLRSIPLWAVAAPEVFSRGWLFPQAVQKLPGWCSIVTDRSHMKYSIIRPWWWHNLSSKLMLSNKIQTAHQIHKGMREFFGETQQFFPDARNIGQYSEMGTCRTFFMKPGNLITLLFLVLKHTVRGIILSHFGVLILL